MWLSPRATVARALPAISSEGMAKTTAAMDAALALLQDLLTAHAP